MRSLFVDAEAEWAARGAASALHVVVLDEMDAICRSRGALVGDTTGVRDSVVNQLLAKMDGISTVGNLLVVGLTNRKELIDPALLRPGRFEVHVKVGLPDAVGREQILRIQMRALVGRLAPDARARALGDGEDGDGVGELARLTEDTGCRARGRCALGEQPLARHVTQRVDGGGRRARRDRDRSARGRAPSGRGGRGAARVVAAAADDPARASRSSGATSSIRFARSRPRGHRPRTPARRARALRAGPSRTLAAHWASAHASGLARPRTCTVPLFSSGLPIASAPSRSHSRRRCDELARHLWCYLRGGRRRRWQTRTVKAANIKRCTGACALL